MGHRLTNMLAQRTAAGLDLERLARKAGVGESCIRVAEAGGAISVTESQRIADALGVSLATLGKIDHT